jgi:hypothetical protein
MHYTEFYEKVKLNDEGKYDVAVDYKFGERVYSSDGVADNASAAARLLKHYRKEFKASLKVPF